MPKARCIRALLLFMGMAACSSPEVPALDAATPEPDGYVPESCSDTVVAAEDFGVGVALSTAGRRASVPSLAARNDGALVAWHEAGEDGADFRYTILIGDCIVETRALTERLEPLSAPKRAAVAATATGYVMAYQAMQDEVSVLRALWLDALGNVVSGPETISDPQIWAAMTSIAASGDDVAFAWTDSQRHYFARRGDVERVDAQPVGTELEALGLVNTPHIAIAADSTLALAWSDGGPNSENRDVLVATRPVGGAFGVPQNISETPGYMSTDVDVHANRDGGINVVWAQMDTDRVDVFEVEHARRDPLGEMTSVQRYGALESVAWSPDSIEGGGAVWHIGGPAGGALMHAAEPGATPRRVVPNLQGGQAQMAQQGDGDQVLVFVESAESRVTIARRSSAPR